MAIMASKGPEEAIDFPSLESERAVRSVALEPSRSPAPREEDVVDWICEAEKSLERGVRGYWKWANGRLEKGLVLRAGDRELPATRNGLHDDVCFFYARFQELGFGAVEEGLDNC